MATYTTVQGDMWDSIAYSQLGSTNYTNLLMEANLKHRETFTFPAGVVLTLPDIPDTPAASTLPPWKR